MQFSRMEKLGFGVLVTAWVVWGTNKIGDKLVHAEEPAKMGFEVAVAGGGAAEAAAPKEPEKPVAELIASADPKHGEKVFGACKACHTADTSGKNKIGPNLWNVVGRKKATEPGFSYSDAFHKLEGNWTDADLEKFIHSPKEFAPGTKMTFAGIKKNKDLAALIVYLHSLSDNPLPLPK